MQFKETVFYRLAKERDVNFIESVPFDGEALESFAKRIEENGKVGEGETAMVKYLSRKVLARMGIRRGLCLMTKQRFLKILLKINLVLSSGITPAKESILKAGDNDFAIFKTKWKCLWCGWRKRKIKAFNDIMSEDGSLAETRQG